MSKRVSKVSKKITQSMYDPNKPMPPIEKRDKSKLLNSDGRKIEEIAIPSINFFDSLTRSQTGIKKIVKKWINKYLKPECKSTAEAELLLFTVEACFGKCPTKEELLVREGINEKNVRTVCVATPFLLWSHTPGRILIQMNNYEEMFGRPNSSYTDLEKCKVDYFCDRLFLDFPRGPLADCVLIEKCIDFLLQFASNVSAGKSSLSIGLNFLERFVKSYSKADKDNKDSIYLIIFKMFESFVMRYCTDEDKEIEEMCHQAYINMLENGISYVRELYPRAQQEKRADPESRETLVAKKKKKRKQSSGKSKDTGMLHPDSDEEGVPEKEENSSGKDLQEVKADKGKTKMKRKHSDAEEDSVKPVKKDKKKKQKIV